jgi:PAS domain S-box-containing protein
MEFALNPRWSMTESVWKTVILSLIISLLVLTVFCLSRGIDTVFMHLYYFPIVLMAYHYHRKGIVYTGIFCVIYISLVYFFTYPDRIEGEAGIIRAIVFVCIAAVVALLSENLEKQKAEHLAVFKSAEESLMKVDLNSLSIIEVNPRLSEMLGWSPEDMKGSHLDRVWSDDAARRDFIRQISQNGAVRSHESTITAKDGSLHDVIISAGMLHDRNAIFTLTDVSGQKQAEKRMRALMQMNESIIMNANVWLMVLDKTGKVLVWNKAAEDISGYRSDEVVGTTLIWKRIYPDKEYRKKITGNIVTIIQTDNFFENLETTIRCRDGQEKVISWNTRGLTGTSAGVLQYIAIGRDITLLRRAVETIREREHLYNSTLNDMLTFVAVLKPDGEVVFVNNTPLTMIGKSLEGVRGMKFYDVEWWTYSDAARELLKDDVKRCASKEMIHREVQVRTLSGMIWIDFSIHPVIGDDGVVQYLIPEGRDITERKKVEDALAESEHKFRRFFNTSRDPVFITSKDGQWIDLNDAAVEVFGYADRDELLTVKIADLYSDPVKRKEHIRIISEMGFSKDYPVDLRKKDGTIMHTLVTAVARKDENGDVIGFQGTVRDITELKRAEEALIIAGKKLNLLNSITRHDINNQLMALDVFIQLSREMTNDPAMREIFDKEVKISATISEQIIFTKDYQEMGVKAPGWQNVHATIRRAAEALPMQNVRIDVDSTDLEVFADPLFEKVFYNLIDNALRYGGERMTTIRVSSHTAGEKLVIVFEDDGVGISVEDKKHLFERGFGKNTGLGLFLAREVLSITGLSISETGEPGRGARFEIAIPEGAARSLR